MAKLLWVAANGDSPWDTRKTLVTEALEAGADAVLVNDGEANKVKELGSIDVVGEDVKAKFIKITNKEEELAAAKEAGSGTVVVSTTDWTIIPWENMIAAKQKKKGVLIADVSTVKDAKTAFETLEVGVDGVLFSGKAAEVKKVKELIDKMSSSKMELVTAKITKVKNVGMGDRVCVDTASLFEKGEGMLVGSASSGMFLVHSETIESEYVAARPFRVNAGAVHAYTILPNGKTTYLSELEAGDEVLAVNHKGDTRTLIVGRMKIEKRPLMLIEAVAGKKTIKSLVQNAETIRLTSKEGKALSVAQLKKGDEVLAYVEEGGRHFGMAVKESINEK